MKFPRASTAAVTAPTSSSPPSSSPMVTPTTTKPTTSKTTKSGARKHSASPPSSVGSTGYYSQQNNAQRKRTKRQAAGGLVAGLFGGGSSQPQQTQGQQSVVKMTPSGKKSTAQPRPVVTVPPRGIGPVYDPNDDDVLCGRGGRINAHLGNQRFRVVVMARKKEYLAPETKKLAKAHIAADIVQHIRARGGRFLKEESNGAWYDIGDAKAIKKVGQALREDSQEVRNNSDDDDNNHANNNNAGVGRPVSSKTVSVALPHGATAAVTQPPVIPQRSPLVEQVSSTYEPLPFHPQATPATTANTHNMGPPMSVLPTGGYRQQTGDVSGAAAAAMREHQDDNQSTGLAFDHVFHPTTTAESAISGLTNDRSDLPSRNANNSLRASSGHHQYPVFHQQTSRQAPTFSPTRPGSDLSGFSRPGLMRSASWVDGAASFTEMSWAEHSLRGGGIPEATGGNSSIMSSGGRSLFSSQMLRNSNSNTNDSDSIFEVLMQGSVTSGSSGRRISGASSQQQHLQLQPQQQLQYQHGLPYGQQLYRPTHLRSQQSSTMHSAVPHFNISSGASVASMSITSASLASLGSIKSIMSDLSENLVALDLAEPRMMLGDM